MSENKRPFKEFEIRWRDSVGLERCPYLVRWVLVLWGRALRLHHWLGSDDQRHRHNHAYWMLIICLWGSYTDRNEAGDDVLRVGSIRFRRAAHKHCVLVAPGGCWTLLVTGKARHKHGFFLPGRTEPMRFLRYFSRYGHHPCDADQLSAHG